MWKHRRIERGFLMIERTSRSVIRVRTKSAILFDKGDHGLNVLFTEHAHRDRLTERSPIHGSEPSFRPAPMESTLDELPKSKLLPGTDAGAESWECRTAVPPDLNPDPHRFKITCSRERLRKSRRLRECLKKSRICKKSDLMPSSIQSVADGSKHCRVVNSLQHANGSAGGSVSVLYSMLTIDRNHRTCTLNAMTRSLSSGSSSKT